MDRIREFYTGVILGTVLFTGACYVSRNRQETQEAPRPEVRRLIKNDATIIEKDIARKCLVHYLYPEDVSKSYWGGADTVKIINCDR